MNNIKKKSLKKLMLYKLVMASSLTVFMTVNASNPVFAEFTVNYGPTGEHSIQNATVIRQAGSNTTVITTQSGVKGSKINWNTFDAGRNHVIDFVFSDKNQYSLNAIKGNQPSYIYGKIINSANPGSVFLINRNGIVFGKGSSVNVDSFFASTFEGDILENNGDINLALRRGNDLSPKAIYIDNGANITAAKSISFASNAIYSSGNVSGRNIQYVTGDGVTFQLNEDYSVKSFRDVINKTDNMLIDYDYKIEEFNQYTPKYDKLNNGNISLQSGAIKANKVANIGGEIYIYADTGIELGGTKVLEVNAGKNVIFEWGSILEADSKITLEQNDDFKLNRQKNSYLQTRSIEIKTKNDFYLSGNSDIEAGTKKFTIKAKSHSAEVYDFNEQIKYPSLNTTGKVTLVDTANGVNVDSQMLSLFGDGKLEVKNTDSDADLIVDDIDTSRELKLVSARNILSGKNILNHNNAVLSLSADNNIKMSLMGSGNVSASDADIRLTQVYGDLNIGEINTNKNVVLKAIEGNIYTTSGGLINHGSGTLKLKASNGIDASLKGLGEVNADIAGSNQGYFFATAFSSDFSPEYSRIGRGIKLTQTQGNLLIKNINSNGNRVVLTANDGDIYTATEGVINHGAGDLKLNALGKISAELKGKGLTFAKLKGIGDGINLNQLKGNLNIGKINSNNNAVNLTANDGSILTRYYSRGINHGSGKLTLIADSYINAALKGSGDVSATLNKDALTYEDYEGGIWLRQIKGDLNISDINSRNNYVSLMTNDGSINSTAAINHGLGWLDLTAYNGNIDVITQGVGDLSAESSGDSIKITELGNDLNVARLEFRYPGEGNYKYFARAFSEGEGEYQSEGYSEESYNIPRYATLTSAGRLTFTRNQLNVKNADVNLTATDFDPMENTLYTIGDVALNDTLGGLTLTDRIVDSLGQGNLLINNLDLYGQDNKGTTITISGDITLGHIENTRNLMINNIIQDTDILTTLNFDPNNGRGSSITTNGGLLLIATDKYDGSNGKIFSQNGILENLTSNYFNSPVFGSLESLTGEYTEILSKKPAPVNPIDERRLLTDARRPVALTTQTRFNLIRPTVSGLPEVFNIQEYRLGITPPAETWLYGNNRNTFSPGAIAGINNLTPALGETLIPVAAASNLDNEEDESGMSINAAVYTQSKITLDD